MPDQAADDFNQMADGFLASMQGEPFNFLQSAAWQRGWLMHSDWKWQRIQAAATTTASTHGTGACHE